MVSYELNVSIVQRDVWIEVLTLYTLNLFRVIFLTRVRSYIDILGFLTIENFHSFGEEGIIYAGFTTCSSGADKIRIIGIPERFGGIRPGARIRVSVQINAADREYKGSCCRSTIFVYNLVGGVHGQSCYRIYIVVIVGSSSVLSGVRYIITRIGIIINRSGLINYVNTCVAIDCGHICIIRSAIRDTISLTKIYGTVIIPFIVRLNVSFPVRCIDSIFFSVICECLSGRRRIVGLCLHRTDFKNPIILATLQVIQKTVSTLVNLIAIVCIPCHYRRRCRSRICIIRIRTSFHFVIR